MSLSIEKKLLAWFNLKNTKGIGTKTIFKLIEKFGNPENFESKQDEIIKSEIAKEELLKEIFVEKKIVDWEKILTEMDKLSIKFISILDEQYPENLKNIFNPPLYLFVRGNLRAEFFKNTFAIVGTRKPSFYGKQQTKIIAENLAKAGLVIVSGLAYGIDSISHLAAVSQKKSTIAVLGTGCNNIYPSSNKNLAEEILANDGLLISENFPFTPPEPWVFPARNRIISGISKGVLVTEGEQDSGALLTCKFALEQNRDIFALPGDVNRPQAQGPNYIIKKGAKFITTADDIISEYNAFYSKKETNVKIDISNLDDDEKAIFNFIESLQSPLSIDEILLKANLPINIVLKVLSSLEIKNMINRQAGGKYIVNYSK